MAGATGVAGAPGVGQGLVVEQQRRPGAAQVPFQVAGEQAEEQMRADPAFLAVADGAFTIEVVAARAVAWSRLKTLNESVLPEVSRGVVG